MRISIYSLDDLALFKNLYTSREEVEKRAGFSMEWSRVESKNPNTRFICVEASLGF